MLTLLKKFSFEASHRLPSHKGPCDRLHGHTYHLEIEVQGKVDTITGMVMDFSDLKAIVMREVVDQMDHQHLNNLFKNPTAENLVKAIVESLQANIKMISSNLSLYKVVLWETDNNAVIWRRRALEDGL